MGQFLSYRQMMEKGKKALTGVVGLIIFLVIVFSSGGPDA
jgi:flagellin-like protein